MARRVIHKQVEIIDQPIGAVWSLLSGFGAIKGWMPRIDSCSIEGDGVGAVRIVSMGGMDFREKLEIYDPIAHIVSYRILEPTGLPISGGYGTVRLDGKGSDKTQITWTSEAEEIDDAAFPVVQSVMEPFIISCIEGLQATLTRPAILSA